MTKELAELAGIMCGDGCLSSKKQKNMIYICGHKFDDRDYHEKKVVDLFLKIFNKKVVVQERKKENALFIRFSDKKIFDMLHSIGIPIGKKYDHLHVTNEINNSNELGFCFIRGLVDTDGSIIFSKQHRNFRYYPRIEIASKSEAFLREILFILISNGFYGSVSKKGIHFRLEIPGFQNLNRWLVLIGFNNPKHLKKIETFLGSHTPSTRILTGQQY